VASTSVDSMEAELGQTFSWALESLRLDQLFFNSRITSLANNGHAMVVSVRAQLNSGYLKYSTISAGNYDSTFLKGFAALNAMKTRPYFIFQHEPDSTSAKASCTSSTSNSVCGPQF